MTSTHDSMLIHVTRFTRVQAQVRDQVSEVLKDITDRLTYGEGSATGAVPPRGEALPRRPHADRKEARRQSGTSPT